MTLKRLLLLLLLTLTAWPVMAQTTTTGTITDPQGNPYANGTASAQKSVATGQVQPPPVNVTTNGSGTFSMSLPSPASYIFTICAAPTQIGPTGNPTPSLVCFSNVNPIAISGGSQDVSGSLNPVAKSLGPNITGVSGVVSAGTAGQLAQYAVNGNTVSGTTSVPFSYLTSFPAACPANQVAVQVGLTLGCASLTTSYLPLTGTWAFTGTMSGNYFNSGTVTNNGPVVNNAGVTSNTETVTGVANLNGGGALNGSFSGPTTLNAVKIFENAQIVDASLSRGGIDICDEWNKAYLALPSTGGPIWVFENPSGTAYNCTTPIVMGVSGKIARVESAMTAATINWTPTTGTNLQVNTGSNHLPSIIRGVNFTGPGVGTSTTGILVGTNLIDQVLLDSVYVSNFGTGITVNNGFNITLDHSALIGNGVGYSMPLNGELNRIVNSNISNGATGISLTGTAIDLAVEATSLDANTTCAIVVSGTGGGAVYAKSNHWENPSLGTACYINDTHSGSNWTWHISGGQMLDNVTTGTLGQLMTFGSGDFNIDGLNVFSAGRTLTQIINTSSLNCEMKLSLIKTGSASARPSFAGSCPVANVIDLSLDNGVPFAPTLGGNPITTTIAKGTAAMTTAAITTGTCGTTVTVAATGTLTTSKIVANLNGAPGQGTLTLFAWPTANNVNFSWCNPTAGSVTPAAATVNWEVH